MKIVIPNYCTADSFEENVSVTLRAMGHDVMTMGEMSIHKKSSPFYRTYKDIKKKLLKTQSDQEKWLVLQLTLFKPDLIICLTQAMSEEVLFIARRAGVKVVAWWGDTAANMSGKGLCHREWDLIFIKDHYAAFKLRTLNLNATQLYEAMNPMWHKPVSEQQNNQIVLAGSFYDYRHYLTTLLIERGIDVGLYGARLPFWADGEIQKRHTGKFITRDEKSRVFGAALAVLNSTGMSEFSSINCRTFEISGTGGLQIMEYRPSIEECFEPGKEILVYKTLDELFEIINWAMKYPQEMRGIRAAAAKRSFNEHTYAHRLEIILNSVKQL